MLKEMADRLEEFQAEMTPKAEAHMGSEAGFEAYQVRAAAFFASVFPPPRGAFFLAQSRAARRHLCPLSLPPRSAP